jgi:signal transduction histidine kinase
MPYVCKHQPPRPLTGSLPEKSGAGLMRKSCVTLFSSISVIAMTTSASASVLQTLSQIGLNIQTHHITGLVASIGVSIFAATTAVFYVRERNIWQERERDMSDQIAHLQERADLADLMIVAEPKMVIIWRTRDARPVIEGSLKEIAPATTSILGFGQWLPPQQASQIDNAIERLKMRGEAFKMVLESVNGRHIEAVGQAVGRQAIVRLQEVTLLRHKLVKCEKALTIKTREAALFQAFAQHIPHPAWLRDSSGVLVWCNTAYEIAVEGASSKPNGEFAPIPELLERIDREEAEEKRKKEEPFRKRITSVVAGARRLLDVYEQSSLEGFIGIAVDVNEVHDLQLDIERQKAAHVRTLNTVRTGVAVFNGAQHLIFHNSAYRDVFSLDAAFLENEPSDGEVLDRLRSERKLPEQSDFKIWKAQHLAAYQSVETKEEWWHLPDGRTLRVTIHPNSRDGVTYLFDDVTEQLHLESRYNAFMRVQNETLDTLQEGVAVFGSDGLFKFCNPAFVKLWSLPDDLIKRLDTSESVHIDEIAHATRAITLDDPAWSEIKAVVVGLYDARKSRAFRIPLVNGTHLDGAVAPLPEGATLITFTDVTATVNVERALTERNDALEQASQLRDNFVHHVSYELRSPLTSIIGFSQMLSDETFGALNPKQREYTSHIMQSSATLLGIVNDILDLATIDNGLIELNLDKVDVSQSLQEVAHALKERLNESELDLKIDVSDDAASMIGDAKRIRQVVYNLLSNAIGFSSKGQKITITAARDEGGYLRITVTDQGRGIPQEVQDKVFHRFETHALGSRHRGVGLGLAIVRAFVELHGGHVSLQSQEGKGTAVTCHFPDQRIQPPIKDENNTQNTASKAQAA